MNKNIHNRITFLDYLRIISISLVFLNHIFMDELTRIYNGNYHVIFKSIAWVIMKNGGETGVIIFFLISGYIITTVISFEKPSAFIIKRFFRIYPLFASAIILESLYNYFNYHTQFVLSIFLQRILLLGDVFNTPVALYGVEWTLRCEMAFYILIFIFKTTGVTKHPNLTVFIYALITAVLSVYNVIPNTNEFNRGYFSLFFPFLFIGSAICLMECNKIKKTLVTLLSSFIMIVYLKNTVIIRPGSDMVMASVFALVIFLLAWKYKVKFKNTFLVVQASDLTYSFYLMHYWTWHILFSTCNIYFGTFTSYPITLLSLILACLAIRKAIEIPGIKIGKLVVSRYI